MNRQEIVARGYDAAQRVAESEGMELVEVELHGSGPRRVLRVYIDKPGGVSHRDCEVLSRQLSVILDVEDLVPGGSYTLEVSSPGVERKLMRPSDYERFLGRKIKLVLREPVEGRRYWEGVLAAFAEGVVTLESRRGQRLRVVLEQIERAHLKFEW